MEPREAVEVLLDAVPEFRTIYDEGKYAGDDGKPMLHIVFGDLAIWFEGEVAGEPELASRLWQTVEELLRRGGPYAEDALAVSFIEWFCLGDESRQQMIKDAAPMQGSATRKLVEPYWRMEAVAAQRLERRREQHRRRN